MSVHNSISQNEKIKILKCIETINDKACYLEIFKIIYLNNIEYTKNCNGVYFNISTMPENVLNLIRDVLNNCQ